LAEECRALIAREGPCATGDAKLTGGHGLRARFVIHAVGPVWSGGDAGEDAQLASAYARALTLARDVGAQSIAFPAISTGIYGFPAERAANIAVAAIMSDLVAHEVPARVVLCCFGAQSAAIYLRVLENVSLGDKVHKI
jgi:O-acetyl-ADP-ribose deacetylase (regulator of RNase III)